MADSQHEKTLDELTNKLAKKMAMLNPNSQLLFATIMRLGAAEAIMDQTQQLFTVLSLDSEKFDTEIDSILANIRKYNEQFK